MKLKEYPDSLASYLRDKETQFGKMSNWAELRRDYIREWAKQNNKQDIIIEDEQKQGLVEKIGSAAKAVGKEFVEEVKTAFTPESVKKDIGDLAAGPILAGGGVLEATKALGGGIGGWSLNENGDWVKKEYAPKTPERAASVPMEEGKAPTFATAPSEQTAVAQPTGERVVPAGYGAKQARAAATAVGGAEVVNAKMPTIIPAEKMGKLKPIGDFLNSAYGAGQNPFEFAGQQIPTVVLFDGLGKVLAGIASPYEQQVVKALMTKNPQLNNIIKKTTGITSEAGKIYTVGGTLGAAANPEDRLGGFVEGGQGAVAFVGMLRLMGYSGKALENAKKWSKAQKGKVVVDAIGDMTPDLFERWVKGQKNEPELRELYSHLQEALTHPVSGMRIRPPKGIEQTKTGSLTMLDASQLTMVNDTGVGPGAEVVRKRFGTLGRAAGDKYIRQIADAIRSETNGTDISAWQGKGSDEFFLQSPTMTPDELNLVKERIQAKVPQETFTGIGKGGKETTGTIGIVQSSGAVPIEGDFKAAMQRAGIKGDAKPVEPISKTVLVEQELDIGSEVAAGELSPAVGMSVGKARPNVVDATKVEFEDPTVEARWNAAHGLGSETFVQKLSRVGTEVKDIFTRHFRHLDPKKHAMAVDILRRSQDSNSRSGARAVKDLQGMTAGLGPKDMTVFERFVQLRDLEASIAEGLYEGKDLPFGLRDAESVKGELLKYQTLVERHPELKKSVELRDRLHTALLEEAVDLGIMPSTLLEKPQTYYRRQILDYARLIDSVKKLSSGAGMKDFPKGWQRKRTGSSLDYNTNLFEAEYEVLKGLRSKIAAKRTLNDIRANYDVGRDGDAPNGYVDWNAKPGSRWVDTGGVADEIINAVISASERMENLPEHAKGLRAQIDEIIKGANKYSAPKNQMRVPKEIAKTLDEVGKFPDDNILDIVARKSLGAWKQYVLLNPTRFFKYNLNNTSGDVDAVIAYNPKILKNVSAAMRESWANWKRNIESTDVKEAKELSVLDAGWTPQEVAGINDARLINDITGKSDGNYLRKYFASARDATQYRESILRLAAYKHFKSEILAGKNPLGVSNPAELAQIKDPKVRAAKLARELLGDYGNLTVAGNYIRSRLLPFYSWMEINAPRYIKLLQNAPIEGNSGTWVRGAAIGAKKVAVKGAQSLILFSAVNAWNEVAKKMFNISDDELTDIGRTQLHVIVGKTPSGRPVTVKFQGALNDALDWVGAGNLYEDIQDLTSGKATVGEKLTDMAKAPVNKVVQGLRPDIKLFTEVSTGKRMYPDIFKQGRIMDRAQHVVSSVGGKAFDMAYRGLTGKPVRDVKEELATMFLTYTNPDIGEIQYINTRDMGFKWAERQGKEWTGGEPTKRSTALYYYKQAIKYGDAKAEKKYLDEYMKLGGDWSGIGKSISKMSPLSGLNEEELENFLREQKPEDVDRIQQAYRWYLDNIVDDDVRDKVVSDPYVANAQSLAERLKETESAVRSFYPDKEDENAP